MRRIKIFFLFCITGLILAQPAADSTTVMPIAIYVQNEISGLPQVPPEQLDAISSESPEYQRGYCKGYIKELKEIRKKRQSGMLRRNRHRRIVHITSWSQRVTIHPERYPTTRPASTSPE